MSDDAAAAHDPILEELRALRATIAEQSARLERLDRVVDRARSADGDTLVFSHGHASRALAARWLGLPVSEGRLLRLDTSTVSVLGHEREQPVVLRWNS